MLALTFHGRRDLRLEEVPQPSPAPGEVLLKVSGCLLSQSVIDFNIEGHLVDLTEPHPRTGVGFGYVMGQQFGGLIEAVGEGVDPARVGEAVAVAPAVGCGDCTSCANGQPNHCALLVYHGLVGQNGGLASHCVVPAPNAIAMPRPELTFLFEGLLVVHNLIRKVRGWLAETKRPVLVLGAGPVGLGAAAVIRDLYGHRVVLREVLPGRSERARKLGFEVLAGADREQMHDVVLDCAGTNPETGGSALLDGLGRVTKGGVLGVVGTYLHSTPIEVMDVLTREITLTMSFAYGDVDIAELVPRLGELDLDVEDIVEWVDLGTAFREGLVRAEVDRDSYSMMVVRP